jgi:hypothetical protein
MWLILNSYQDRAVWISRPNSVSLLFVGLDEKRSLQKKGGYRRWSVRSHFGKIKKHEDQLRRTTRKPHTTDAKRIKVTVVFLNIFYELEELCHFCVTNLSIEHKIKIKLTVSNFPFFITIHNFLFISRFKELCLGKHSKFDTHSFLLTITDTSFLSCGATPQIGPRSPRFWTFLHHTQTHHTR